MHSFVFDFQAPIGNLRQTDICMTFSVPFFGPVLGILFRSSVIFNLDHLLMRNRSVSLLIFFKNLDYAGIC